MPPDSSSRSAASRVLIIKRLEYLIQKMVMRVDDEILWCISSMAEEVARCVDGVRAEEEGRRGVKRGARQNVDDKELSEEEKRRKEKETRVDRYWTVYEQSTQLPVLKKHAFELSRTEYKHLVYPSVENYDDRMEQQILVQYLSMSPIQLSLTFTPRLTSSQKHSQRLRDDDPQLSNRNPWLVLIGNLGLSLTAIEQAPLNLNALQLTDLVINSRSDLTRLIQNHYLKKAYMSNALKAILSWNTLGNINMLVTDVGTGVKDFFYEPYQGYIRGPAQGTKGLLKGSASLVGYTAKGTIGTVGRIIGSFSNGMLVLADDREYLNLRQGYSVNDGAP